MDSVKQYALSISIPTYGSPTAIKETVNNLLKIKRKDIEIVVVDNDETGQQIGKFMEAITDSRFHYYRNDTNIGRSANIARAVDMAASENVLLMSSDDTINLDAIDIIIDKIQKNPRYAVIMGKIKTDHQGIWGYNGKEKTYKAGYEALQSVPLMGNLIPMVVNKKYLDFDLLYRQKETYMQVRINLMAVGKGDFIGIEDVMGNAIDNITWQTERELECYKNADGDEFQKLWDVGACYYSPQARAEQLKQNLTSIEGHRTLRLSHLLHLIDKFTTSAVFSSLQYVAACHSPGVVRNGGSVGFIGYREALDIFEKKMYAFFLEREMKGLYYYTGNLHDKIQNELLNVKHAEKIMDEALDIGRVAVYGEGREAKFLCGILDIMGVSIAKEINGQAALVPVNFEWSIENELVQKGAKKIHFMDWMWRYFMIIWCDRHRDAEYMDIRFSTMF